MKKFLNRIWAAIANLFGLIRDETKKWIPVAINVVEAVKSVMDGPVDDVLAAIIKKAIPGDADDIMIDKIQSVVHAWLPKILLELNLMNRISTITDTNEQLKAILAEIRLNSDETKNVLYHGLASLILEKLSDGKLSWSDSTAIAEYYYKNFLKK